MKPVTYKAKVPQEHHERLNDLLIAARIVVERQLSDRSKTSSKFYKELPSTIAKSLSAKYQRNPNCKRVTRLCLPVCGDKGTRVKLVDGGIRVPSVSKQRTIPCQFPLPVSGFIRHVEFHKRSGDWFMSYTYNTPCSEAIKPVGCIGVDRNSVGNIATMSEAGGKVRFVGFNADRWKQNFRFRKSKILSQGRKRLASRLRRKQFNRTRCENHRASKTIVAFAAEHCSAIALEELRLSKGAKRYAERRQWAHFQLQQFIQYKAALRGIPVVLVDPAFTSQDCSRCGSRNKPDGKSYSCSNCWHKTHRDANASFNIAMRGWKSICGNGNGLNVPLSGCIGEALSGTAKSVSLTG